MRFNIYIFLGQCLAICNQNILSTAKALVGENVRPARRGEFPFIASIMRMNRRNSSPENDHFCTGALVSDQNVLTGSHCLQDESLSGIKIIIGDINLRSSNRHYPMWWMTYNEWATLMSIAIEFETNDVALIRLMEAIHHNIEPARISTMRVGSLYGLNVTTAGWGQTATDASPRMLNMVNLKIISNEECNVRTSRLQGEAINIHHRILCTIAEPYALVHSGDSGGPLLYENEIVAVNYGTCPLPDVIVHPEKVNVHFSIDYYRNFITAMNR